MTDGMGGGMRMGEHMEQPSPEMQQVGADYKENPMEMSLEAIDREIQQNQLAMNTLEDKLGVAAAGDPAMAELDTRRIRLEAAKKAKSAPAEVGQEPESANV